MTASSTIPTRARRSTAARASRPATNAATQATRGQLVTYQGTPVVTYFFSTSGGRTESVENTPLGTEPKPWLTSVEDPYDNVSPRHRWGPIPMSLATAGTRLGGLVKGRFRGIRVVRRGVSPRVVAADVIGSRGRTRVPGATLRARFGLFDTWAYFTAIRSEPAPAPHAACAAPCCRRAGMRGSPCNAAWPGAGSLRRARVGAAGRYRVGLPSPGTYRVRSAGAAGPAVRLS